MNTNKSILSKFLKKQININKRLTVKNNLVNSKNVNCRRLFSSGAQLLNDKTNNRILKSKYQSVTIPECSLVDYIWKNLDKWPEKTALVCGETGRKYKYSEIYRYSRALAANLRTKLKLKDNDAVAIVLPNVPEYGIVALGVLQANCVATLVNPAYTSDEIRTQLENSEAKFVITSDDQFATVQEAVRKLRRDIQILAVDTKGRGIPNGAIDFKEFCDVKTDTDVIDRLPRRSPDDLACLPYSSGTTGLPKGVELRNKNLVANLVQVSNSGYEFTKETSESHQDIVPAILPFYHIYGLQLLLNDKLSKGCQLVTLTKFTSDLFIKMLKEYRVHQLYLVPPLVMFMTLNDDVKPKYLEETRIILSGAAPFGASDIETFLEKMDGHKIHVLQGYGLTETSPVVAFQHPNMEIRLGSIGQILPNTQCMIADIETGQPLGPNESGELYVKGPQVMTRYYKNEEATRNTFTEDGWFKTGDMARYDDEEYLYITDRLKELIKVKGFQVAPAELEALLRAHPHVDDVAVVGIPDVISGEVPKAFIVPSKDSPRSEKEIQEYVESKVAKYKKLAGGVVFVESIPKNPSGKILRRQLK